MSMSRLSGWAVVGVCAALCGWSGCAGGGGAGDDASGYQSATAKFPSFDVTTQQAISDEEAVPEAALAAGIRKVELRYTVENNVPLASNRFEFFLTERSLPVVLDPLVVDSVTVGGFDPDADRVIDITSKTAEFFAENATFRVGGRLTDDVPLGDLTVRKINVVFYYE